jgi:signal transduction histidine kinase
MTTCDNPRGPGGPVKSTVRILYLEDSPFDRDLVQDAIEQNGLDCETVQVESPPAFESALRTGTFDLILCDYNVPGYDGFSALQLARRIHPVTPVLIISGSAGEEEIVNCLHLGATDYILKHRLERLGPAVRRALAEVEALQRAQDMEAENKKLEAQFLRVQRLENIGALAAGIAHDLNNALAPVMMGVDLIKEKITDPDGLHMLETMRGCAQRGAEMVKQILSFARGVTGNLSLLNVKHLVNEITKLSKDTFPRSITIESKVASGLYPIEGNATQLHQVLLNLSVNARDAMPEGGTLRIHANNVFLENATIAGRSEKVSGPHILLSVSDSGIGMPPDVLSRIFEPFFTTKGPTKGTGLGLSTVKGIVDAHNGFMEVASALGQGTTFQIYIPALVQAEAVAGDTDADRLPTAHGELVLLVDDDLAVLEMVREALETFGYRVLTARNGLEALPIYRKHHTEIAVVVTDMMMPHLDGAGTIRAMRSLDPNAKIVSVSGLGSESALVKAHDLPVDAFLKKPYTTRELLDTLHKVRLEKDPCSPVPLISQTEPTH